MSRFIDKRKNNWQRLEDLLGLVEMSTLRGLNRMEVRELGQLYRRTASDLAIARAESRDPRLINYLNNLVIRAHGKIYRADNQGLGLIRRFFTVDFPQTFRRTAGYTILAFAVFVLFAVMAFAGTWADPEFSELAGIPAGWRTDIIENQTRWWLRLNEQSQIGSSEIMTNNIQVSFLAFAYGAFLGVGSLYILALNGALLGAVFALCYRTNTVFGNDLLAFVAGHGVIELTCIFICGGAGIMLGSAILMPSDLSRAESLKTRGVEAVRLVVGSAFLLVIAGIIEGFVSPAPISSIFKFSVAILTGIALFSYLLFAGRSVDVESLATK